MASTVPPQWPWRRSTQRSGTSRPQKRTGNTRDNNKVLTATCGIVAAAGLSIGAAAIANAATPAASTAATSYSTAYGALADPGDRGSHDAAVSGTELATVKATVKAKDSTVSVSEVCKDPDGSYDVFGTKAGNRVLLEVSKDLKTVTSNSNAGQ